MDSDGPSVELFDKNRNKIDGAYKKILDNGPEESIFDKNGNKLYPYYMKVLSDIPRDGMCAISQMPISQKSYFSKNQLRFLTIFFCDMGFLQNGNLRNGMFPWR
jgi:hypothetical protein